MKILTSMDDQFINSVYQAINNSIENENFSVVDLAKQVHLSRSMLHRKLIKLTGKSAGCIINEVRMIRAKELLESNAASVSEVSFKVGFSNPGYFTRVFKNYFKVAPADIKKGYSISSNSPDGLKKRHPKFVKALFFFSLLFTLAVISAIIILIFKDNKKVEKSIAILPFQNLSSSDKNQYFADGIVEDLLNRLSKVDGLKVISRTSSEIFRDKGTKTVTEISEILGVSYIVEGSIQKDTDHVLITVQLIDAKKDDHILSKQYKKHLNDIFNLQSTIAEDIAIELSFALTEKQLNAIQLSKTKNVKAFELYQMGRYHSSKRWIDGYTKGNEYYYKAIEEDPEYGLAYAGLSDNYHLMAIQLWIDKIEGRNNAVKLARKAIELDPQLAEPHAVLGGLYTYVDWDWKNAEKELLFAIKLNPNYSTAYQYYSELLAITGKPNEARMYLNKAMSLDPCSFIIRYLSSLYYFNENKYNEALAENKICQELVKNHEWPVSLEFRINVLKGDKKAALESFKKLGKIFNEWTAEQAEEEYRKNGLNGLFRLRLTKGKWIFEYEKAQYYIVLGEYNKAKEILKTYINCRSIDPLEIKSPEYSKLDSDPDFAALKNKIVQPLIAAEQ